MLKQVDILDRRNVSGELSGLSVSDGIKLGIYEMKIDMLSWLIKQIIIQNH